MRFADRACTVAESFENDNQVYTFTGNCMITGQSYSVKVPGKELFNYRQGEYIQKAMPSVSAEDREFLISGISPTGWGTL
jgi:hypothetical protein